MAEDFSELYALSEDLTEVPAEAHPRIVQALKYTSVEIKQDWAQGADRSGLENYARSIDFDIDASNDVIESEIGPNQGKKQGRFGFVEDANGDVQSAPQHAGRDAAEANEENFYRGLEIAATNALIDKLGA